MSVFIIGNARRYEVASEAFVQPGSMARDAFSQRQVKLGASLRLRRDGSNVSLSVPWKRGAACESDGFYARVLPEDAEPGLADLDRRIEEKRRELAALHAERQEYLAANVIRGERITTRHLTPLSELSRR